MREVGGEELRSGANAAVEKASVGRPEAGRRLGERVLPLRVRVVVARRSEISLRRAEIFSRHAETFHSPAGGNTRRAGKSDSSRREYAAPPASIRAPGARLLLLACRANLLGAPS